MVLTPLEAFWTPPLVVPELAYKKQPPIRICLDQPIISSVDFSHLLSLCAIADAAVERVQKMPHLAENFDDSILEQIEDVCRQMSPKEPGQVLERLGLLDAFPYLRQGLDGGGQLQAVTSSPGSSYLSYVSHLNQVVMIGTQLYHDACIPQHHKYCAHQIALLYQCLNMLQGDTKPIRRLVEVRFEEIKQVSEAKNPVLDMELSHWVQEVTWLCREEIKNCPTYIHRKLAPIMSILHSKLHE